MEVAGEGCFHRVKKEQLEGTSTISDPFPSAVAYVDEDAEQDVMEAQRDAPLTTCSQSSAAVVDDIFKRGLSATAALASAASLGPSTALTTWTVYTEVVADGPKCFVPETQFLRVDGSQASVRAICRGDKLQGPMGVAVVDHVQHHASHGPIVGLDIRLLADFDNIHVCATRGSMHLKVTYDHRMTLENFDYRRAGDLQQGDLIFTSQGEGEVTKVEYLDGLSPVFEVAFQGDRPAFMALTSTSDSMAVAFGSDQSLPYSPEEFVEFRFKGRICASMGLAEEWLQEKLLGRCNEFRLKFWFTRKFAVWVPLESADEFWETVKQLLPKGSKLYRRPVELVELSPSIDLDAISTPPPLTP
mmetsp:Transcript_122047/g.222006  ORF Transcript_122047/g.222006 Transcript_122047/m.222006 type:complete len:358 (-) Transcript_122047:240-1313(-)